MKNIGIIINANELRKKEKEIEAEHPDWISALEKPGCYRWYAEINELKKLLDTNYFNIKDFKTSKTKGLKTFYHIYTGKATQKLYDRVVNQHIKQKHKHPKSNKLNNGLSSLRKTISCLVCKGKLINSTEKTNDFIDKLKIEIFPLNKNEINKFEYNDINDEENNILILNTKGNTRANKEYLANLRDLKKKQRT